MHVLPVGNAGNITAYWKGYREYAADGVISTTPRMFGIQAAGAAPLVHGSPVPHPRHDRHGDPDRQSGLLGGSGDRTRGVGRPVRGGPGRRILHAYRLLAAEEGVFVEPASAASVAGLLATAADGRLPKGSLVVCTVTGHGLKDPGTALEGLSEIEPLTVDPSCRRAGVGPGVNTADVLGSAEAA